MNSKVKDHTKEMMFHGPLLLRIIVGGSSVSGAMPDTYFGLLTRNRWRLLLCALEVTKLFFYIPQTTSCQGHSSLSYILCIS